MLPDAATPSTSWRTAGHSKTHILVYPDHVPQLHSQTWRALRTSCTSSSPAMQRSDMTAQHCVAPDCCRPGHCRLSATQAAMSLNAEPSEVELPSSLTCCCRRPLLGDAVRHAAGNCTDAEHSGIAHCMCEVTSVHKSFISRCAACLMAATGWIPGWHSIRDCMTHAHTSGVLQLHQYALLEGSDQ